MAHTISLDSLNLLIDRLFPADNGNTGDADARIAKNIGKNIIGLVESNGRYFYQKVNSRQELVFDAAVMPSNSIKEFVFPRSEKICSYRHEGKDLIVSDSEISFTPQIIFGVRPCDAACLPILDKIFSWDYQDRFYQLRRESTTVITLACMKSDKHCFCTSVGLSPDSPSGADAMLLQIDATSFEVRIFTEKGADVFRGQTEESDKTGQAAEPPTVKFDAENVANQLRTQFDNPLFDQTSLRCVGCGSCTYVCPTCHCFDIVDEGGTNQGNRIKNWDTCQFGMFTIHASGHNPRAGQSARQRNRIQHKFNIYPGKFGKILCTGCGNCTRRCAASLGIYPVLEEIEKMPPRPEENG